MNMKRTVALSLVCALCLFCGGAMAYGDQGINGFRAGEVTIDGDLSEWNLSSPAVMNRAEQIVRDAGQWTGPEDVGVETYIMWDENNLYLAAKVLDDTPFMYREGFPPDMADSLVLFLSTDAAADPAREAYAATDFRLTLILDDYDFCTGIDREMVADQQGFETCGEDGCDQVLAGYEAAIAEIEGGYLFECVIPLANFSNENIPPLVPKAGMTIGMELAMFDLDFPCPGVATVRIEWCGSIDADENPSLWGTLTFCE